MPLQCQDFVRSIICIKQLSVKLPVHYLWMEQRGAKAEFLSSTDASVWRVIHTDNFSGLEREKRGIFLAHMKILPRAKEYKHKIWQCQALMFPQTLLFMGGSPDSNANTPHICCCCDTRQFCTGKQNCSKWLSCINMNVGKGKTLAVTIILMQ